MTLVCDLKAPRGKTMVAGALGLKYVGGPMLLLAFSQHRKINVLHCKFECMGPSQEWGPEYMCTLPDGSYASESPSS